jgi:uncharacterized protein YjbI with pentapeptide repeats
MEEPQLTFCDLSEADFSNMTIWKAEFSLSDLTGANCNGAKLDDGQFYCTRFHGTKLNRTSLVFADLQRADLMEAELEGANLTDARVDGANFQGSTGTPIASAETLAYIEAQREVFNRFYPKKAKSS